MHRHSSIIEAPHTGVNLSGITNITTLLHCLDSRLEPNRGDGLTMHFPLLSGRGRELEPGVHPQTPADEPEMQCSAGYARGHQLSAMSGSFSPAGRASGSPAEIAGNGLLPLCCRSCRLSRRQHPVLRVLRTRPPHQLQVGEHARRNDHRGQGQHLRLLQAPDHLGFLAHEGEQEAAQ